VEGGLVGADAAHLEGDDPAGQLVAGREALDLLALRELVQAEAVAEDRAAEALAEAPRVAVVMAVGQEGRDRRRPLEPFQALIGHAGVDQHPLIGEAVGVEGDVPARVYGGPVVDAGEDLAHRGSLARPPGGRRRR
jgi:hypothetical protein